MVPTLAACGGGSSTPLTVSDFCLQKATAECNGVAGLCSITTKDCETTREAACMSFVATVNVAPRVFVPGNVAACVNKTKSVYAESLIKPADLDAVADVCNYVFQGPALDLTACTTKYDCKNAKDICDKGECAAPTNVAAGAQCANFGAVCPTTQYCNAVGAAMMCVAKGALAAACSATAPCDATKMLTCGAAGTCVMQSATGGACTTNADCLAAAPYCNPYAGNKCGTGLTFSAASASCAAFSGSATGTAGAGGGTAGASGDSAADATGTAGASGSDASTTDASTTDAADAATTG
ncbi:MAG TPA: hypothetical protein VH560_02185 [Polyangia bacterium]|nr:hypothetical protein [Polyangia bacterium]